jgi:hypothetical protein
MNGPSGRRPANGMRPTADTPAFIFQQCLGRRVMPGVRRAMWLILFEPNCISIVLAHVD